MGVRPLDMTQVVQNTPEVNRTHANEHRPEIVQQHFAEQMTKETQQQDRQVIQTNKTEENRVDRDGKQGGNGGYSSRKKNKNKKDAKTAAPRAASSNMFDVSI